MKNSYPPSLHVLTPSTCIKKTETKKNSRPPSLHALTASTYIYIIVQKKIVKQNSYPPSLHALTPSYRSIIPKGPEAGPLLMSKAVSCVCERGRGRERETILSHYYYYQIIIIITLLLLLSNSHGASHPESPLLSSYVGQRTYMGQCLYQTVTEHRTSEELVHVFTVTRHCPIYVLCPTYDDTTYGMMMMIVMGLFTVTSSVPLLSSSSFRT